MDKLAADEGMLFTNIYLLRQPHGARNGRVLSSFPTAAPTTIVKRHLSDKWRHRPGLKRDGQLDGFVYGGRGIFDGMSSSPRGMVTIVIEHIPRFTPIIPRRRYHGWGVSMRIFFHGPSRVPSLSAAGNHISAPSFRFQSQTFTLTRKAKFRRPDQHKAGNAVKYSDYAWDNSSGPRKRKRLDKHHFCVVADHGARVYGKQSIPIHSYEIPLLIAGPGGGQSSEPHFALGCSLDVSPTISGLLGRPYERCSSGATC